MPKTHFDASILDILKSMDYLIILEWTYYTSCHKSKSEEEVAQ
jgi:hypothetical protein